MNAVPAISAHRSSDLQPPRFPQYGHTARLPTPEAVERICARVAAEHDLSLNNVLYGYGKANKTARKAALLAVIAETGCSVTGLAMVQGLNPTTIVRALAYDPAVATPTPRTRRPKPSLSLARGEQPTGGQGLPVKPAVRDAIVAEVAAQHGVRPRDILNLKSRASRIVPARHEVMWRLRQLLARDGKVKHSFPAIGLALGLHHTAIMNGVMRHERRMADVGRASA